MNQSFEMLIAICITNTRCRLLEKHILDAILEKQLKYMAGIKCLSQMLIVIDFIIHVCENNKINILFFKYKCDCIYQF